ncbi:glycosyltransferase family 2 protein [Sphingomonas sp. SORGH_AS_0950]|uniref:glycosyltransferase family 2 protein n=1 Tax=Sphingomonas sp. SORGH_AS_0950 TaxID=3041792 RepID=UPI0027D8534B|nr:glycosyltransferase family 2 protein [Sphingomonas sp. SORGH_AS_0950]
MIVRDEERVLARCLASVAGLYDALVIVDTGSTDGTVAIAERHGATVYHYAGANGPDGLIHDFADARNLALSKVRGDWIWQMDADEVLLDGHAAVRRIIAGAAADAIAVRMRSDGSEWHSARLFRRSAVQFYVGRIHEYLQHDGTTLNSDEIVVANLPDKAGKETAFCRNTRIAQAEIEAGRGTSRLWHNLGNEHFRAGDFAQAALCYDMSLVLGGYPIGRFHGSFYKASCHLVLGEIDAALREVERSLRLGPHFAEAHCLRGDCLFMQERYSDAAESYRAALACRGRRPDSPFPAQPAMEEEHPTRQLALIELLL